MSFAQIAPGAVATMQIVAKMVATTPGQQITNSATVTAGVLDPVPANNTASANVGLPTLEPTGDADGDGLSNEFETKYGLDPFGGPGSGPGDDADGDGKTNLQELQEGTHPRGFVITYLAEGATGAFFDTRLAIANPSALPALVLTRFQRADGVTIRDYRVLPPMSRTTIDVENIPGLEAAEFSTLIEADVQVVADRTMTWDKSGYGSHAERGILTRTATKWYFAEGATFYNFELFYLIQNPNDQAAQVKVTYLLPAPAAPLVKNYVVKPQSRFNIWVDEEGRTDPALAALATAELSAIIESTNGVPIIAERAMYLNRPGQAARGRSRECRRHRARHAVVPGRGCDRQLLRPVHPDRQPAGRRRRDVQAEFLLSNGRGDHQDVPGRGQQPLQHLGRPGGSRRWPTRRCRRASRRPTTCRSSSSARCGGRARRRTRGTKRTTARARPRRVRGGRWPKANWAARARSRRTSSSPTPRAFAGTIRATVLFEDGSAPISREYVVPANSRFNIAPSPTSSSPRLAARGSG